MFITLPCVLSKKLWSPFFSCDPNLSIFNVWIDCLDPNLPRLCMFANRDIAKNEQLTFDYKQRTGSDSESGMYQ